MKLHADKADRFTVTAYGEGWILVNGQRHTDHCLLSSATGVLPWSPSNFDELTPSHFEQILDLPERPELLIFGTGPKLRFVRPVALQALMSQRIGVETMDTAAACRTYNILVGEGRRVAAALFIGD